MSATPGRSEGSIPCPRCGVEVRRDQDWCLHCGAAATSRIMRAPSWKKAMALVAGAILLGLAAFAITLSVRSHDAERSVAEQPESSAAPETQPTTTPQAPATTPTTSTAPTTPTTPATPATTPTTPRAPSTPPAAKNPLAPWPAGEQAFTVIIRQTRNRAEAQQRARALSRQGVQTGLLRSSDYRGLDQGFFMVYSGRYKSRAEANAASRRLRPRAPTNYIAFVRQR